MSIPVCAIAGNDATSANTLTIRGCFECYGGNALMQICDRIGYITDDNSLPQASGFGNSSHFDSLVHESIISQGAYLDSVRQHVKKFKRQ
jgi:hypothetical protein